MTKLEKCFWEIHFDYVVNPQKVKIYPTVYLSGENSYSVMFKEPTKKELLVSNEYFNKLLRDLHE
jgi:hypothetical protein